MKHILIVINNLNIGGIQKALLELLKALSKRDDFSVDLFCCKQSGEFFSEIPKEIKILPRNKWAELSESTLESCKKLGKRYYLFRLFASLWAKILNKKFPAKLLCRKIKIEDEYDVAISYSQPIHEKTFCTLTNEIVLNCCKAKKKVTFVHCDFASYGGNTPANRALYKKFDTIAVVSDSVGKVLEKCIPETKDKIQTVYNFCNSEGIIELSNQNPKKYSTTTLITVARLSEEKGILRCVSLMKKLKDNNLNFEWHIVGGGSLKNTIKKMIVDYGMENTIILEGQQINPYRYMKNADYLFVPSFHEAAPVVFDEAIVLNLPILTTDTLSAWELVGQRNAGMVCENNEEAIYNMLETALRNPQEKCEKIINQGICKKQFDSLCK